MRLIKQLLPLSLLVLAGCISPPPAMDYSAFRAADPHSIVVLPPINNTPEVIAPYGVMSQLLAPLAESGYYVFPVALVEQTFRNNGMSVATDAQSVAFDKLQQIFGADAGLYLTIDNYGTSYVVLSSETVVSVTATLVDLKTGTVLWKNSASASSAEGRNSNGGGLVGMLLEAAINQVFETVTDRGFDIAAITNERLFSARSYNGLLYGPRSPKYGQPAVSEKK